MMFTIIRHLIKKRFLKTAFLKSLVGLFLLFIPWYSFANICLHPLEMAALRHSKPRDNSVEARLKRAEDKKEQLEKKVEELRKEDIKEQKALLENSLKDDNQTYKNRNKFSTTDMVDLIYGYISKPYNKLEDTIDKESDTYKALPGKITSSSRKYFKGNGYINAELFCKDFAANDTESRDNCLTAIERFEKLSERQSELKEQIAEAKQDIGDLEDDLWEKEFSGEEDTEARAECTWCDTLEEIRALNKPTTGQIIGNVLSVAGGAALAYYGYQSGKREGRRIDDSRMWQGYAPQGSSHLAWGNASMGLPFIANGVHGLTGGNSNYGNWACNPGHASMSSMYSPFAHYNMMTPGMQWGNQWGNPMMGMNAGMQFNAGMPWAANPMAMMNPALSMQFNSPWAMNQRMPWGRGNPMMGMNAGMQFNAGMPWAANPMAMMNPALSMQFNSPWAMNQRMPWGRGNPMMGMNAGMQFNAGMPWAANPMAMMNPALSMQFNSPWAMNQRMPWGRGNPMTMNNQHMQMQFQFQQQQMQQQLQMQQVWNQQMQAIQKERMHQQQIVGTLEQEMFKIWNQIQLVRFGGVQSSALGATMASFPGTNSTGTLAGGPQHNPASNTGQSGGDGFTIDWD